MQEPYCLYSHPKQLEQTIKNVQIEKLQYLSKTYKIQEMQQQLQTKVDMQYRNLGPTGIKVSIISYGNWVNSDYEQTLELTCELVKKAWDLGINFFDTAELYGFGSGELQLGEALRRLNVPREQLVITTKIYWSSWNNMPNQNGLSRKHIIEGMKNSIKRLGLSYVDVVFSHRPDYQTPMQQICRAFDWLIRNGYAFYWGTSEWNADDIVHARMICQKYGFSKPVVEQPQYNLYHRDKMEFGYRHLFKENKLGTTVWSPLAGGLLTGKYNNGIPEGSRFDKNPQLKQRYDKLFSEQEKAKTIAGLNKFAQIAKELDCTMSQLAMAWVINNPDVSTAITGVTKVSQLEDTIKAVAVRRKFTPEIERRIEEAFDTAPSGKLYMCKGHVEKSRRFVTGGYLPSVVSQKDKNN